MFNSEENLPTPNEQKLIDVGFSWQGAKDMIIQVEKSCGITLTDIDKQVDSLVKSFNNSPVLREDVMRHVMRHEGT